LQAIYRYILVVYPNLLTWRSRQSQTLLIIITWILAFVLPIPLVITNEIVYNVENQICQMPLRFSVLIVLIAIFIYMIPISMLQFIYLKLVLYVRGISKRVIRVNTLFHVQRELKMVQRTVVLVIILFIVGFPYVLFICMSFFTEPPKYHFRIAYLFIDMSLVFVIIALFQFTDPLKASIMKQMKRRRNIVVPTVG
jgi:hypothetical protein